MAWRTRLKTALATVVLRRRVLSRWAHRTLPTKRMAAGVLLFDDSGRLLLVKPSYRKTWLIPAGVVEQDEPPWLGARREASEEIGIEIGELRLAGIDWRPADEFYNESLHFIFEGGTLSKDQIAALKPDGVEIVGHRFVTKKEANNLLGKHLGRRVLACWQHEGDRPLIMNGGEPAPHIL